MTSAQTTIDAGDRNARLLRTLALVQSAGSMLEPVWDPHQRAGIAYRGSDSVLDSDGLAGDLEELADGDYLERVFIERLTHCPTCESHAVNVHEACMTCASSNLVQFKALFHFRCGYVGPVTTFREEPNGLRCPKCSRLLKDLGTDHDSPGEYFQCRSCTATFQVPEVGARCLSCGARFAGSAMQAIRQRDVYAYRISSLGKAALQENKLLDPAASLKADGMLERRHTMLDFIESERKRRIERGSRFGTIAIGLGKSGKVPDNLATTIARKGDRPFKLGRLDAAHLVVVLPDASESTTKSVRDQIAAAGTPGLQAAVVEIADSDSITDALDIATRRLDLHV